MFRSVVSVRTRQIDALFVFADLLVAANVITGASARFTVQQSVPRVTSLANARRFTFRAIRNGAANTYAFLVFELSFLAFDGLDSFFLCGRYSCAAVVRASQLDRLRVGVSRCEQQADRRQKQYLFHDFPLFHSKSFPGLSLRETGKARTSLLRFTFCYVQAKHRPSAASIPVSVFSGASLPVCSQIVRYDE